MAFELISKRTQDRRTFNDKIVVKKTVISFPMRLRKAEKGFFKFVEIWKEDDKYGFRFLEYTKNGYLLFRNSIKRQKRGVPKSIPMGVYNFTKEGELYVIDTKENLQKGEEDRINNNITTETQ